MANPYPTRSRSSIFQSIVTSAIIGVLIIIFGRFLLGLLRSFIFYGFVLLVLFYQRKIIVHYFKEWQALYRRNELLGILAAIGIFLFSGPLFILLLGKSIIDLKDTAIGKEVVAEVGKFTQKTSPKDSNSAQRKPSENRNPDYTDEDSKPIF